MNEQEVKEAIHLGNTVKCNEGEYPSIRRILQELVSKYIDSWDIVRAQVALLEVKRLDQKFELRGLKSDCESL